ncbi:MAG: hypothetical protein BWY59_02210 [Verrucomicrobia bacterium ADurb.Bin345]|nr:MAG: hypothetical protein BWY59_02210 [Verrucomicrobia bacterium ADurb.Bin345]
MCRLAGTPAGTQRAVKEKANRKLLSEARNLLASEIVQVTGCTEPASVAFAFMLASRQLRVPFDPRTGKAILHGSPEVLRNASTAVVPFLNRRGLRAVVAAGLSSKARSFDLFPGVNLYSARRLLKLRGWLAVHRASQGGVYVRAVLRMPGESAEVVINGHHDEVRSVSRNGRPVLRRRARRNNMIGMRDIMAVVAARDRRLEAVAREFICRQVRGDSKLPVAERIPVLIRERMCGSSDPVMTITGSGNHGIYLGVPFYELYRKQGSRILPAALLALLAGIHMTAKRTRISEECGLGTKASPALAAGLAYARGADCAQIMRLMRSVSRALRQLECHGAKATCAGKARKALKVVMRKVDTTVASR